MYHIAPGDGRPNFHVHRFATSLNAVGRGTHPWCCHASRIDSARRLLVAGQRRIPCPILLVLLFVWRVGPWAKVRTAGGWYPRRYATPGTQAGATAPPGADDRPVSG